MYSRRNFRSITKYVFYKKYKNILKGEKMSGQVYKTLLEDLDKGEEVALITKYNLETKKVEKNLYKLDELEARKNVKF